MKRTPAKHATGSAEGSLSEPLGPLYKLRLYVAGMTPRSALAIANTREICDEHLKGRHDLRVIDLCQQPALAEGAQIVALPTLIREMPQPLRRIIGDLSDRERVLIALDLRPVA
jgi:circadian clock protein KaiB